MTENERITRGSVTLWRHRSIPDWFEGTINGITLQPGAFSGQNLRDLITAAAAALGDEVVVVSREQLRDRLFMAALHGAQGGTAHDIATNAIAYLTAAPAGTGREE